MPMKTWVKVVEPLKDKTGEIVLDASGDPKMRTNYGLVVVGLPNGNALNVAFRNKHKEAVPRKTAAIETKYIYPLESGVYQFTNEEWESLFEQAPTEEEREWEAQQIRQGEEELRREREAEEEKRRNQNPARYKEMSRDTLNKSRANYLKRHGAAVLKKLARAQCIRIYDGDFRCSKSISTSIYDGTVSNINDWCSTRI